MLDSNNECKEYLVTYTGNGGMSLQRKWANEHFVVGQQYEVTYGIINSSSTELYWKDGLEPNVVYKLDDNFVRA